MYRNRMKYILYMYAAYSDCTFIIFLWPCTVLYAYAYNVYSTVQNKYNHIDAHVHVCNVHVL